jgi:hypothetical protein
MTKKYIGSTLDSFFEELGEREEVELLTQKKLLAAKIERAMTRQKMTQVELAKAMRTSRAPSGPTAGRSGAIQGFMVAVVSAFSIARWSALAAASQVELSTP